MIRKCPKCGEDKLITVFTAFKGDNPYWGIDCESCGFSVRSVKSLDDARFLWEHAGNPNTLIPCPFCGSDAEIRHGHSHYYARCTNQECLVKTKRYDNMEKAKDAWNRRVNE